MDLSQKLFGTVFKNPTVLASGIWGITASSWKEVARRGAGAVTTKSLWPREHQGNRNPTIISTATWTLNAVGVPDAGPQKAIDEIGEYVKERPVPIIANVIGLNPDDFASITASLVALRPDAYEVNLSTPTFLKLRGKLFAEDEAEVRAILGAVKREAKGIPVLAKLTPNVPNIGEIARACMDAGADGITAVNTVGPGMAIDLRSRMPILAAHKGGLSGPALKPIAVRCVAEIFEATNGKLPIIGTGGVYTGEDAIEMLLAGASLVGVGTAIVDRGPDTFQKIVDEMQEWCTNERVQNVEELTGAMHRELQKRGGTGLGMKHA